MLQSDEENCQFSSVTAKGRPSNINSTKRFGGLRTKDANSIRKIRWIKGGHEYSRGGGLEQEDPTGRRDDAIKVSAGSERMLPSSW